MSKLPRVTQQLFAGNAQPTDTAAFGTMRTGKPTYTSDIAQLMNTPQFLQGWLAAVEEGFAPFMEEMTGVQKVFAQQIAYLFQQGVPEYDAGTTYYKGSLVKVISDTDFVIYSSLIDDNTGNTPTAGAQWKLVYNTADPMQLISNMSQSIDTSTTNYPSNAAVRSFVLANALPDQTGHNGQFLQTNGTSADWTNVDLSPYQLISNIAQNLTSPSATTYPSTQAVANESSRIISIMHNSVLDYAPNWNTFQNIVSGTQVFRAPTRGWLYMYAGGYNAPYVLCYIAGRRFNGQSWNDNDLNNHTLFIPLKPGDAVYNISYSGNRTACGFITAING